MGEHRVRLCCRVTFTLRVMDRHRADSFLLTRWYLPECFLALVRRSDTGLPASSGRPGFTW